MKVIGSGFGRTGTLSTKKALEELGFGPCYHMEEVLRHRGHVGTWHDIGRGRPVDWRRLFAGFESAVDFPASVVYQELMEAFPDAKVVHTVRDPQRWYDSTLETIYQGRTLVPTWLRRLVPFTGRFAEMVDLMVWDRVFDGRFEDREYAIARFEEWTAEVIATVPPERLLVFDVRDGWEPLCEFLGVLQPGGEFPRVNDRESMLRRFRFVRVVSQSLPLVGAGSTVAVLALLRRRGRRRAQKLASR
jgi:hypothetical protein